MRFILNDDNHLDSLKDRIVNSYDILTELVQSKN